MTRPHSQPATRRDELLELAAVMFAERGLRATTVRDIADSAGILSGSLYHHFASKEEMVDEVGVTLLHEIGHHLGLDEDELMARGLD